MRQIFSVRFFAAVGAVVGLFFLLTTVFAANEVIEGGDGEGPESVEAHTIDFVDQVYSSSDPSFAVRNGVAASDTELVIDDARAVTIVAGTPGVDHCGSVDESGACAIVADMLGEGVVWFAFVPMGPGRTVEFPAIDILDDGYAQLVNGWRILYAPILDRRCQDANGDDVDFVSYREFRDILGDDFTTIYSLDSRQFEAVVCGRRVPYAPVVTDETPNSSLPLLPAAATTVPTATTTPTSSTTTLPVTSIP